VLSKMSRKIRKMAQSNMHLSLCTVPMAGNAIFMSMSDHISVLVLEGLRALNIVSVTSNYHSVSIVPGTSARIVRIDQKVYTNLAQEWYSDVI
jgi:hypothetical protein